MSSISPHLAVAVQLLTTVCPHPYARRSGYEAHVTQWMQICTVTLVQTSDTAWDGRLLQHLPQSLGSGRYMILSSCMLSHTCIRANDDEKAQACDVLKTG